MKSAEFYLNFYWTQNRSALLDLAASLDRVQSADDFQGVQSDPRWMVMLKALEILSHSKKHRVEALQILFSDPTQEPMDASDGRKSAIGVHKNCC